MLGHLFAGLRNLLILGVLAAGGVWLYVHYQIGKSMDKLAARVAPVAILSYDSAFWYFGGDVGVRGVTLAPGRDTGLPTLRIAEAVLHTPGLRYVIGFRGDDTFPLSLGITLQGVRHETTDGFGAQPTPTSYSGLPFEALACGDITEFRAPDMRNMRLAGLDTTVRGRYYITPPDGVNLILVQETGGLAEITLELNLLVPNLAAANRHRATPDLRLETLKLTLEASEFNSRRNRYCAKRAGTSVEEFVDAHVRAVVSELRDRKLLAGPTVMEQYREFAAGRGPWKFISRPDRPLPLAALAVTDPLDLVERLRLNSALQATVASPVIVTRIAGEARPVESEPASPTAAPVATVPTPAAGLTAETGALRHVRWLPVEPAAAPDYVGRAVRITTRFGQEYSGRLEAVGEGQLQVATRFPGGEATVPIPIDHVTSIKVSEY